MVRERTDCAPSYAKADKILEKNWTFCKSRSKEVDNIDPSLAALHMVRIAKPLAEVINCSLSTGVISDAIKISKIVVLLKQGDKDNVSNYRPISVLPYFL